jgi:glycosyltransferase involved in cell wall biosynthesis
LKIAVDARPLLHPHNGIGQYLHNLLEGLLPGSPHRWFLYTAEPFDPPSNWHTAVLRCGRPGSRLGRIAFAQALFPKWARSDGCDVFWSPRHQLPLRLPAGIATALTIHDLTWKTHPRTMTTSGRWWERIMTPRSIHAADCIFTTSEAVQRSLAQHFPQALAKVSVIPLSSNIDLIAAQAREIDVPYFVFCGSVEPRKNLERLLHAHAGLCTHAETGAANTRVNPPHRLVIITGDSWHSTVVDRLIADNATHVSVFRAISETRKAGLLQHADFVVQPSLYEGFGLPVVEALKLGLPVLAANTGALPEVAGSAAVYVDPFSEADIAQALQRLCNDSGLRNRLRAAAHKEADRFDWATAAAATLQQLEALQPGR